MIKFRGKEYNNIEEIKEEYKYTDLEELLYVNRDQKEEYWNYLNYYATLDEWHGIRFFNRAFLFKVLGFSTDLVAEIRSKVDHSSTRMSIGKEIEKSTSFDKACRANKIKKSEREEIKNFAKENNMDDFEAMWRYVVDNHNFMFRGKRYKDSLEAAKANGLSKWDYNKLLKRYKEVTEDILEKFIREVYSVSFKGERYRSIEDLCKKINIDFDEAKRLSETYEVHILNALEVLMVGEIKVNRKLYTSLEEACRDLRLDITEVMENFGNRYNESLSKIIRRMSNNRYAFRGQNFKSIRSICNKYHIDYDTFLQYKYEHCLNWSNAMERLLSKNDIIKINLAEELTSSATYKFYQMENV